MCFSPSQTPTCVTAANTLQKVSYLFFVDTKNDPAYTFKASALCTKDEICDTLESFLHIWTMYKLIYFLFPFKIFHTKMSLVYNQMLAHRHGRAKPSFIPPGTMIKLFWLIYDFNTASLQIGTASLPKVVQLRQARISLISYSKRIDKKLTSFKILASWLTISIR